MRHPAGGRWRPTLCAGRRSPCIPRTTRESPPTRWTWASWAARAHGSPIGGGGRAERMMSRWRIGLGLCVEASNEVSDEGGGDDDGPRGDQPNGHGVEELPCRQPMVLVDHAFAEEGHDGEAAAEDERAGLQKEEPEREDRPGRRRAREKAE